MKTPAQTLREDRIAQVQVMANMVYGYNGSDPNKPPYKKDHMADMTLQEIIDFEVDKAKAECRRVAMECVGEEEKESYEFVKGYRKGYEANKTRNEIRQALEEKLK